MKKIITLFLSLITLSSFAQVASSEVNANNPNSFHLSFTNGEIDLATLENKEGLFTEIHIDGLTKSYDIGNPDLPVFSRLIEIPEEGEIVVSILNKEIKIDTYRASGAGGQHVNKTDSAVRITHLESGIVVQCQNERSQHKNRSSAMRVLKARIFEVEQEKLNAEKKEQEQSKKKIEWGSQIRSYVLDDARIKDLRTGVENRNTQSVLDGNLDKFIEASLKSGL